MGQIVAHVMRRPATRKDFLASDLGDMVPKGLDDPVRLLELRRQEDI